MNSIDVMDDFKLSTGNPYADLNLTHRLALMPEYWALVEYLEKKGLLERAEFFEVLNQKCTQAVVTANILRREDDEQAD